MIFLFLKVHKVVFIGIRLCVTCARSVYVSGPKYECLLFMRVDLSSLAISRWLCCHIYVLFGLDTFPPLLYLVRLEMISCARGIAGCKIICSLNLRDLNVLYFG